VIRSMLLLLFLPLASVAAGPGDQLFALQRTDSARFPDADDAGPTFATGARLTVLVVEGERLRVMGPDDTIGWIPADRVAGLGELPDDIREIVISELLGRSGAGGGLIGP